MTAYRRLINSIKQVLNPTPSAPVEEEIHSHSTLATVQPTVSYVPTRIPRPAHTLSRAQISKSALKVLYQLREAGYQAFLVGGGVRDVLLGRTPKDFDVVTNALPEQVRSLFSNCRLIGRRFVLAHVTFGREIIEVATFRAHHATGSGGLMADGRILQDNVYGSIDEDAARRDFTINALYYDISDFSLLDYANGIADLQAGIIRLIGDPLLRYQEDPVRMLRAIRFSAKLGFKLADSTAEPILEMSNLLEGIPIARLYEEVLKLFLSGHALQSFVLLRQFGLFKQLFPSVEAGFSDPTALVLVEQALRNTDERVANDKSVTPAFLFACLLWTSLNHISQTYRAQGYPEQESLAEASHKVVNAPNIRVAIPRRITLLIEEIWSLQPRLVKRGRGKRSLKILEHPTFRAGYDFLLLREQVGEAVGDSVNWWTRLQNANEEERHAILFEPIKSNKAKHRRKSRRRPKIVPPDATE